MSATRRTKGISITLPVELIDKLSIFVSNKKGLNASKMIKNILEDFFATNDKEKNNYFPDLDSSSFLVSIERYMDVMSIGRVGVTSKIKKGELEVVNLYGSDFIKLPPNDIKNLFCQIDEIKKQLSILKEIVYNDIDRRGMIEDRLGKLEEKVK